MECPLCDKYHKSCNQERCAWWDRTNCRCALVSIAISLGRLADASK